MPIHHPEKFMWDSSDVQWIDTSAEQPVQMAAEEADAARDHLGRYTDHGRRRATSTGPEINDLDADDDLDEDTDEGEPEDPAPPVAVRQPATEARFDIKAYWITGEGRAKWVGKPHPWTALYHHLVKHMPPDSAKRIAAQWHKEVFGIWPGEKKGKNPAGPG
jgi:hypothetical protein